jgi:hypothetical protein
MLSGADSAAGAPRECVKMQLRLGVHGTAQTHASVPTVARAYGDAQQRMTQQLRLSASIGVPADTVRTPTSTSAAPISTSPLHGRADIQRARKGWRSACLRTAHMSTWC